MPASAAFNLEDIKSMISSVQSIIKDVRHLKDSMLDLESEMRILRIKVERSKNPALTADVKKEVLLPLSKMLKTFQDRIIGFDEFIVRDEEVLADLSRILDIVQKSEADIFNSDKLQACLQARKEYIENSLGIVDVHLSLMNLARNYINSIKAAYF